MDSTTTAPDKFHDNSDATVSFAFVLNAVLLLASFLAFDVLLSQRWTHVALAPRLDLGDQTSESFLRRWFGWARLAWRRRAELDRTDLDGAVLVRFCVLGFKFSVVGTLVSCVLLPMYADGNGDAPGFNKYSLSNLSHHHENGQKFWIAVVAAYALTGVFAHLALAEWREFLVLRYNHFERASRGLRGIAAAQAQRSLLVENIPAEDRSEERVRAFFEHLFGAEHVHSCVLQADTTADYQLQALRTATGCCCRRAPPSVIESGVRRTREAITRVQLGSRHPHGSTLLDSPRHAACSDGSATVERGSRADVIQRGVGGITGQIRDRTLQAVCVVQDATMSGGEVSTAFVTLTRVSDRLVAERLVLSRAAGWKVRPAPEAKDIVWRNAAMPQPKMDVRELIGQFFCLQGILWWSVPVASIQAWASASNPDSLISKALPFLSKLHSSVSFVYTILLGYLPVLALMALLRCLPCAFEWLSLIYEGRKVKSTVECLVLSRCLKYQLATLYVTVLSGSLWDSLKTMMEYGPYEAINEFGSQVPQVAVYFITFVLARVGMSLPCLLLRPTVLAAAPVGVANAAAASGRGLTRASVAQSVSQSVSVAACQYPLEAGDVALVLVLALTYCVIAPALMPVCMVYFGLASLVYRWLFLNVYSQENDCAGAMWYDLFYGATTGLILGNLSLASLAGIYQGPQSYEFFLMLFLSSLVFAFLMYCRRYLDGPSRRMTWEDAVNVDRDCGSISEQFRADYYVDPIISSASSAEQLANDRRC
eukprot:TRINITY_DN21089_c0_g1_i1.p1 TRINITY_DN21089_c0_g1~~TRINITY_DN21089_c0_g1_i1.p1  ORF type:complete len:766 (+),score=143.82 TRINITY_DN21089_c0_g1_i1:59-2356(+)